MLPSSSYTRRKSAVSVDKSALELSRTKVRRKSYGFQNLSTVRLSRSSQGHFEGKRPILIFQPTYQLEPYYPFHELPVRRILETELNEAEKHKYHNIESSERAMQMAYEIMTQVRDLHFDRYRVISVVTIGQKRSQCYNNAITFIWDTDRDKYVDAQRENTSCFIQATVFCVYLD